MVPFRMFAFAFLASSVAVSAQQAAQTPQPATATVQKPNDAEKPVCHVTKEGNSLKRTCMTKEQWRQAEQQASQDVDESGLRSSRCPQGSC